MKGKDVAVLVVTGVLGLVAIVLAFSAEATRIKVENVFYTEDGYCTYPETPSMALGIVAAILLLIQQVVISIASGCFCCRKQPCPSSCSGISSIICFIVSWLVFGGAIIMLIFSASLNMHYLVRHYSTEDNICPVGKPGYFAGAGVLCIISVALGVVSYICLMGVEVTRQFVKDGSCTYPSTPAFAIGIVAAIFVLAEQIIINVGMRCFCCGRQKFPCNFCGIFGFILFILAWLSFIISFLGLLAAAISNNKHFISSIQYNRTENGRDQYLCVKGIREMAFLDAAYWCIINLFLNLTFTYGVHRKRIQNENQFKGPANLSA